MRTIFAFKVLTEFRTFYKTKKIRFKTRICNTVLIVRRKLYRTAF